MLYIVFVGKNAKFHENLIKSLQERTIWNLILATSVSFPPHLLATIFMAFHLYVLTQVMNLTQVVNSHYLGWPM